MSSMLINREKKKPANVSISIKSNQPQEYIDIRIGGEIIKIQERDLEYKTDTARIILENLLFPQKREKLKTGKAYRVSAATGEQIKKVITVISYARKYSQLIPLWFKHKILQLVIDGPNPSYSFIYRTANSTDLSLENKDALYECSILLNKSKVQQFWLGAKVLQAWQLGISLPAVLGSNEYLRCRGEYRELYFLNAFWFYLWTKPSLIDNARSFNSVITFLKDYPMPPYFPSGREKGLAPDVVLSIDLNIWKELLRRRRPDLFATGLLALPHIFARSI